MLAENEQKQIDVLDHGYVRLIDVMGSDEDVARAARMSTGGTTKGPEKDAKLLAHLMRNRHTSPFEMGEVKFQMRLPIFVARQFVRHRTSALNESSARYSEMPDLFYHPDQWRAQSARNHQGSSGLLATPADEAEANQMAVHTHNTSSGTYQRLLGLGVAREQARIVLPVSVYTEWQWKQDLHNLFHLLKLRTDPHAQQEIRVFAEAMEELVRPWFPTCFEVWDEYVRHAVVLSRTDAEKVRAVLAQHAPFTSGDVRDAAKALGIDPDDSSSPYVHAVTKPPEP